ncbi:MAG: hypothetical protein WAN05_01440 [Roseiarcus sp.]
MGATPRPATVGPADLPAVGLTVYPDIALLLRVAARGTDFDKKHPIGPRLAARIDRPQTLPIVQPTLPPRWNHTAPT